MNAYPIFEVVRKSVVHGAKTVSFKVGEPPVTIAAIVVGETGVGRKLGVLPVTGVQPEDEVFAATIEKTRRGLYKLVAASAPTDTHHAIVVMRTPIGFRGFNRHEGEDGEPFPGEILCKGVIAQGSAGRMGSGEQLVALVPRGVIFSVYIGGRLYGAPSRYYYIFDGNTIIVVTEEERGLVDGLVDDLVDDYME